MNFKTTIVLLLVVAGLCGYVYMTSNAPPLVPRGSLPKRLFQAFEPDDATAVAFVRSGGKEEVVATRVTIPAPKDTVTGPKEKKVWKLEKPVLDDADAGKINDLLAKVQFLECEKQYDEAASKAVAFGQTELSLTISRPQDKGGDVKIEIGATAGTSDVHFARVSNRPYVYIINKELPNLLERPLFDFRTKQLFSIAGIDVDKLTIKVQAEQGPASQPRLTELVKGKDHFWRLGGEGGDLLDTKKIDDLLPKVRDLKPNGIAADAPSPAALADYGLAQPEIELTLLQEVKDEPPKTETISLGAKVPGKDARYGRLSGRPFVYTIDASALLSELGKVKDGQSLRTDTLLLLHAGTEGVTGLQATWKAPARELKLKKSDKEKGDKEWSLELPSKSFGDETAIKALLRQIAELKVVSREGPDAIKTLEKFGLAEPPLVLTVDEGTVTRVLQIGFPVPEKDGLTYVRRGDEARVLTAKLGDLPQKLDTGSHSLRTKTLLKASHWEALEVKLLGPDGTPLKGADGKPQLNASKKDGKWQLADQPDLDVNDKLAKFLETFDELKAIEIVDDASPVKLPVFGLDKPNKLVVTTESWDSEAQKKKKQDKALLLGKRDGDRVYAMEEGGGAVARIDAELLDRIARGFQKEKEIFSADATFAQWIVVKEGEKEIVRLEKRKDLMEDEWFLGDRKLQKAEVEKVVDLFSKIEASRTEEATDAKKKERGFSPPARKIEIHVKKTWGDKQEETKTLLVSSVSTGKEHEVYAMEEAGSELGVIYDLPLVKLNALIASPPFAQAKTDGVSHVGSPDTAAVSSPNR
ncbi:DUF4340 domain-containing protein [bacterium]|nr:DUF4340 domain-containing protein [bacterium]